MKTIQQLLFTFILTGCLLLLTVFPGYAQNEGGTFEEARQAGVEQDLLAELESRTRQGGIEQQQIEQILRSAVAMAEKDLPAEIAIQKALEGFSKGIPDRQVVSAVNRVQQSMSEAVDVVDPWISKPSVQKMLNNAGGSSEKEFRNNMARAVSKSLVQDISSDVLTSVFDQMEEEAVMAERTPSDMVAAVGILSDLPGESGFSVSMVMRALKGGFDADHLHRLPSAIKMGQQRTQLPAASVMEGVGRQVQEGIPAGQVLENLFEGNINQNPAGPPDGRDNSGRGNENSSGRGN